MHMDLGHYVGVYHPTNVLQLTAGPSKTYVQQRLNQVSNPTEVKVLNQVR